MTRPTALFRLYQGLTALALPFVARSAIKQLRKAGQPVLRAHERLGHATSDRRLGPLIWFHAASAGAAKSILPLIHHIADKAPQVRMVLTSSTASAADAVATHLPKTAVHQFGPLDAGGPLDRFLRHWRPELCVLVDSELWPNLLDRCARRDLPVALLNARLSGTSARGWRRFPDTTAFVLRGIRMAHCQNQGTRDHLRAMGLTIAQTGTDLTTLVTQPNPPRADLETAIAALAGRRVWVAASTHPGDEAPVLAAHTSLLADHPHLCLILAPHNPDRASEICRLIEAEGLTLSQRSNGGSLADGAQVYLADTMGEMDLWYSLSPIVFLGGSFSDVGGHSPFEPAAAHTALLHGPRYAKFRDAYAAFRLADASLEVADGAALSAALAHLLTHPSRAAQLAAHARPSAKDGADVLPDLARALFALAEIDASAPDLNW